MYVAHDSLLLAIHRIRRLTPFLVGQFGTTAMTFAAGVAVARTLGPSGRGMLVVLSVADECLLRIIGRGFPEMAGRTAMQTPANRRRAGRSMLRSSLLSSLLLILPSYWLVGDVFDVRGAGRPGMALAAAFVPMVGAWRALRRSIAIVDGHTVWASVIPMTQWFVVFATVAVGGVSGAKTGLLILTAYLAGAYVALLPALSIPRMSQYDHRNRPMDRPTSPGVRRFAAVGSLATVAAGRLDQLLVYAALGRVSAGLYSAAASVSTGVLQFGNALAWYGYRGAAGSSATAINRRSVNHATLAVAALAVPLALVAPSLVGVVYGPEFTEAGAAARILLLASPLQCRLVLLVVLGAGAGRTTVGATCQVVSIVLNLVLLLPLTALWDVSGAAAAAAFAYLGAALVGERWLALETSRQASAAEQPV